MTTPPEETSFRELRAHNEQQAELERLTSRVARLEGALEAAQRENVENRERLNRVNRSLSWRITQPIRRFRRIFGSVLRKVTLR